MPRRSGFGESFLGVDSKGFIASGEGLLLTDLFRSFGRDSSFAFWFRPLGRDTFLCSAKEKYPKERRSRRLARYAGSLRFS
jgi:hypothetical protein